MTFLADVARWLVSGEHWRGPQGIAHRLAEHVQLSATSLVIACLLALPVGLVLGHIGRGGTLAINLSNIGRAVPSFALLVLALQVWGLGTTPVYVALVALGVPPIVTNTYVGMRGVDAEVREAARGMGLTGRQVLWRVELPLAMPFLLAGVRTAAVQIVATATLAAVIAAGGLGRFIVDGQALRDQVQLFAGAVLVAGLALATELAFAGVQRALTPAGLRRRPGSTPRLAPGAEDEGVTAAASAA